MQPVLSRGWLKAAVPGKLRNEKPLSNFVRAIRRFLPPPAWKICPIWRAILPALATPTNGLCCLSLARKAAALVVYGASYILFTSDDADQLAAWLFVRWLLSPENQADWVNSAGLFPLQAATMGLLTDYAAGHPAWVDAVKLLPQGRTTPQLAAWRTVRVALGDGFNFMFRVDTPVGQVPAILSQLDAIVTDLNK